MRSGREQDEGGSVLSSEAGSEKSRYRPLKKERLAEVKEPDEEGEMNSAVLGEPSFPSYSPFQP